MTTRTASFFVSGLITAALSAGEPSPSGKNPVPGVNPISMKAIDALLAAGKGNAPQPLSARPPENESDLLGIDVSLGYDSHEVFRGLQLGENLFWADVTTSVPLTPGLELGINAWYATEASGDYRELNLGLGILYDAEPYKIGVGYTYFYYPEGSLKPIHTDDDTNELGLTVSRAVGPVDVTLGYYYDLGAGGHYIGLRGSHTWEINDKISLEFGADIAYAVQYYTHGSGFSHFGLRVAMPIQLTERITLTPYLAAVVPLEEFRDYYDELFFGGIRLTIYF